MERIIIILGIIYAVALFFIVHRALDVWYFGLRGVSLMIVGCLLGGLLLSGLTFWVMSKAVEAALATLIVVLNTLLAILRMAVFIPFIFLIMLVVYCMVRHINPLNLTDEEYETLFGETGSQNKSELAARAFGSCINKVRKAPWLSLTASIAIVLLSVWSVIAFLTEKPALQEPVNEPATSSNAETIEQTQNDSIHKEYEIPDTEAQHQTNPTVKLDVINATFDQFCGTWVSEDGNLRFRVSAIKDGYCIAAHITPWERTTEWVLLDSGEQETPLIVGFDSDYYSEDPLSGMLTLWPDVANGGYRAAYQFDRHFADRTKSIIQGEEQICTLEQEENLPQTADIAQCMGTWVTTEGSTLYCNFSESEVPDQVFLEIYDENGQPFASERIPLAVQDKREHAKRVQAKFDLENGTYGEISFVIDRFNEVTLNSAIIYGEYGEKLLLQDNGRKLSRPVDSNASIVYDNYFHGFCRAVSMNDFSYVAYTMLPGSPIYEQQKKVVEDLGARGIREEGRGYEILSEAFLDLYHYELTAEENFLVKYADGTEKIVNQIYTYSFEREDETSLWYLTDMQ